MEKNGISNCLCVQESGDDTVDDSPASDKCVCEKIPLTDDTFYKQSRPFGKLLDYLIQEKPKDNEFLEYRREFRKPKPKSELQLYVKWSKQADSLQLQQEKFGALQEKRRIREAKQGKQRQEKKEKRRQEKEVKWLQWAAQRSIKTAERLKRRVDNLEKNASLNKKAKKNND